ncbi:L-fucose/L-arabinose isomerase family protein [Clostridium sp. DL1XJH146]
MKQHIELGVICLGRNTFDVQAAKDIYEDIIKKLNSLEEVTLHFIEDMVIEVKDAREAALKLSKETLDGIIVISGTFHLGHLILEIDKIMKKPIYLWGLNELPYNGGKIRLNSVCGVNLNASNLYKSGNENYYVNIEDEVDENWIDAIRMKTAIEGANVALLGYHAHGFFNLNVDELKMFKEMGVLFNHYELKDVFSVEIEKDEVESRIEHIKSIFDISKISDYQLEKVAELIVKLKKFVDEKKITALAIRCWPEFADTFGISPCAAMSILQEEDYILSCEGDVEGAISMIAHKAVAGTQPFLADLSQVDLEKDFALMWHCGVAPCNLRDGICNASLEPYFAGGRGVTADFVLKSGEVSILRIDSALGKYRIFMEKGDAISMEKLLKGTYAKVKFEHNIKDVLDRVIYSGVAHHVSMIYGDYTETIKIFARLMGWEVI